MKKWITSERVSWVGILTLLVVILGVASVVIAKDAAVSGSKAAKEATLATAAQQLANACPRNQLNRAWQRVRAREAPSEERADFNQEIAAAYFRITNCQATYAPGYTGKPVYLEAALDECFVKLTEDGYWRDKEPFTNPAVLRSLCHTE